MIAWPSLATLFTSDISRLIGSRFASLPPRGMGGGRLRGYWGGSRDSVHGPLLTRPVSLRGGGGVYHCLDRNETGLVMVLNRLNVVIHSTLIHNHFLRLNYHILAGAVKICLF